mmetsp:Transcript_38221/g.81582  ORF Transcript_38221/g.81582 Transcript_38221/m.81582 type:complete len:130 (-) Transcript_38221:716-1105(-)
MALPSLPTSDSGPAVLPDPEIGHGPVELVSAVFDLGRGPAFLVVALLFSKPRRRYCWPWPPTSDQMFSSFAMALLFLLSLTMAPLTLLDTVVAYLDDGLSIILVSHKPAILTNPGHGPVILMDLGLWPH